MAIPFLLLWGFFSAFFPVSNPSLEGLSCGHSNGFPKADFIPGASAGERVNLEWIFWVIRAGKQTILVDTCFLNPEMIRRWRVENYRRPDQALSSIGVTTGEVSDIILTHAHWDHAGGVSLFPKAMVWIQAKEYEHLKSLFQSGPGTDLRQGFLYEDWRTLDRLKNEGRLQLIQGDQSIVSGIRVRLQGGHTPGLQTVEVRTAKGSVLLLSDSAYFYESIKKLPPSPQDPQIDRLIPGHDVQALNEKF